GRTGAVRRRAGKHAVRRRPGRDRRGVRPPRGLFGGCGGGRALWVLPGLLARGRSLRGRRAGGARGGLSGGAAVGRRGAPRAAAGVTRNVVGTESLGSGAVDDMDAPPRVLSVDLRDGRLISPRPDLAGHDAGAAAPLATALGVREVLVIDLARVGSGSGPPLD